MVRNGSMVQGEKPRVWVKPWWREVWSRARNRGFGSNPVPPQCGPGRETVGLGQTLVAGSAVQGAKSRVWVKPWWREMWSRERNCGFGPSLGGGKCGPGRETAGLGQTRPRPSVVRGAKPRPWVKPGPAAVWSRERNRGPGSNPAPPQCGPWSKTAGLGQTQPRPSVVQGEKLRPRVKRWWREMWSRERNRGPGSTPAPPQCGPGRETAAPGQTLPRRSMVRGAKPRPRVKPGPAAVWSREKNRGPGSSPASPEHGPGRETAGLGQTRPRRSVVQGEKPRPWVKPGPAAAWSRERNRGSGSSSAPPQCGPGRETAGFGSSPAPPECGPGSKTAPPGQTLPRRSVVQGEKTRPWVKPGPARVWSREQNRGFGSTPAPPQCGPGRETAGLGQALPRRSVVQGEKPRPRVKPGPAAVWSREQNRGFGSTPSPPQCGPWSKTAAPGQTRPRRSVVLAPEIQKGVKTNI